MDYLDYIMDYYYKELPEEIQASISRETYTEKRKIVLAIQESEESILPQKLATAFAEQQALVSQKKQNKHNWLPYVAAAGWLLFLLVSSLLWLRKPSPLIVEKMIFAPAPAPKIVYQKDTLLQTITKYQERIVIIRDTLTLPPTPQIVYVKDTVFLAKQPTEILQKGSQNIEGKEKLMLFLHTTE